MLAAAAPAAGLGPHVAAACAAGYRARRNARPDLDTALDEAVVNLLRSERLFTSEQPRERLDDRHLRAERGPGLAELNAHHAAAEHDQAWRDVLRGRGLTVRPGLRDREPGDGRYRPHAPPCGADGPARGGRSSARPPP